MRRPVPGPVEGGLTVTISPAPFFVMKQPKPHLTKYTLVLSTYVRRFDTLEEAEKERDKAVERGEVAWIVPPIGVRL
jgi:hypothetical protein